VRVEICFTQELFRRQGENRIEVFDAVDRPVHAGEAQVDNDNRSHLSVELLPDLPPGTYRVVWHSLSAEDGDNDEGEFSFTYDPQAEVTSTPMGVESPGVPTEGPVSGQAGTPTSLPPDGTQPAGIATSLASPQSSQTGPAAQNSRCLGGAIPVVGLVVAGWILRRPNTITP
jgi:hypothetical protein